MRLSLGYPNEQIEKQLLLGNVGRAQLDQLKPLFSVKDFMQLSSEVKGVPISDAVLAYIMRLVKRTRDQSLCTMGLSPRASQSLAMAARAYAYVSGRDYVIPDDVQAVFPSIAGHRLKAQRSLGMESLVNKILESVDVVGEG
jgi:MoxR-like ATPase